MPEETSRLSAEHLKIAAITPYTSIDYPGYFSAVAFIQGCPWRCRYCHNPHMQPREFPPQYLHSSWEELIALLKRRQGLLDAVVFSGGEPTLDPALADAMSRVKEMGFKIGLHTSGCYPEHVKKVIGLVDWVGLDVKAALSEEVAYRWITGLEKSNPAQNVSESLAIIQAAQVSYECRTTAHPVYLPDAKILSLARELKERGVETFALQVYRKPKELDLLFDNVGHEYPEPETMDESTAMFTPFELLRG